MSDPSQVRKEVLPAGVVRQGAAAIRSLEYARSGRLKKDRKSLGVDGVVRNIVNNDSSNGLLRDAARAAGVGDSVAAQSATSPLHRRYIAVIGAFVTNNREISLSE